MDEMTRKKVSKAMCNFMNAIIRIADEGDYDRDSFVTAIANMFAMMVEISTFENFKTAGGDGADDARKPLEWDGAENG